MPRVQLQLYPSGGVYLTENNPDYLDFIPLQDQTTIDLVSLQNQEQLADSLTFGDSFTYQIGGAALGILLPVEDFVLLDDAVAILENFYELESGDNFLFTDFPLIFLSGALSFSDSLSLSDELNSAIGTTHFNDFYTLSDSISISVFGNPSETAVDSLSLVDTVTVLLSENFVGYLRRYLNDIK